MHVYADNAYWLHLMSFQSCSIPLHLSTYYILTYNIGWYVWVPNLRVVQNETLNHTLILNKRNFVYSNTAIFMLVRELLIGLLATLKEMKELIF